MSEPLPEITVVAAIIRDRRDRLCLSRRPEHKHQGGLWEFPGGKVEEGEPLERALARELDEELGMKAVRSQPFMTVRHRYPDLRVTLHFREVTAYTGEPHGREGQPVEWVPLQELSSRQFPAANQPVVTALKLPRQLVIPPEGLSLRDVLAGIDRLDPGSQGLYLRQWSQSDALPELAARCRERGLRFWIRDDAHLATREDAFGLHLTCGSGPSPRKAGEAGRQDPRDPEEALQNYPGTLSASCHNEAEIAQAVEWGAQMATLSPVHATPTHPDAQPLGWDRFRALVEGKPLVFYALGGVTPQDLDTALHNGAFGTAGIRAFW
ncbi:MAG: NUDIX hydrolase [Alcanivorax sp.]|nr:NUDIX hydrolase [Alcanivorax sp.]